MSALSVCVLAPNGHRNNIKCTPNTTLLQILEEACRKQNLKPEDYDLKHHKKILDTTTTFRFSGLPNNALLELVDVKKLRSDTDVTLALNLENGNRLVGTFSPNVTLLTVLKNLCPESATEDKNPVIIYTRREIYGTELESVTLKSLGITGGRAMIRLIHRSPEELKVQANVAAPLPSKPVEEKPYVRKLLTSPESESLQKPTVEKISEPETSKVTPDTHKDMKPKPFPKSGGTDVLKLAKEKRKSSGFVLGNKEKRVSLSEKIENIKDISEPANCECVTDKSMEVECHKQCEESCTNLTKEINVEEEFIFLGDRNAMLFSLETAKAIPSENLPDDFFDLTIDDAKKLLRDVRKQRHYMEHTPLTTSGGKGLEESKKQLRQLNRYKKAIIRIQFPDRTVLQGTFTPIDTIKSVVEFIREYLQDKSMEFYVYTTPPKEILQEDKKLIELGFLPGALIHFGTDSSHSEILRKDLQNKFTSNSVASLAASKIREENTRKCEPSSEDMDFEVNEEPLVNAGASTSSGITHENYGERKIVKSEEKVPKWFKQ